jgi:hypothetical protein
MTKARELFLIPDGTYTGEAFKKNWRLIRKRIGSWAKPPADVMDDTLQQLHALWHTGDELEWTCSVEDAAVWLNLLVGQACTGADSPEELAKCMDPPEAQAIALVALWLGDREAARFPDGPVGEGLFGRDTPDTWPNQASQSPAMAGIRFTILDPKSLERWKVLGGTQQDDFADRHSRTFRKTVQIPAAQFADE